MEALILLYGENVAILEESCMASADMQWLFYSGEQMVALGPFVLSTIDFAKMLWTSVALLDARPTGDQEVAGLNLTKVGNILLWRLIMK